MYQFGMPHHPVLTSAVLAILLLAASPSGVRAPGIYPAQAGSKAPSSTGSTTCP